MDRLRRQCDQAWHVSTTSTFWTTDITDTLHSTATSSARLSSPLRAAGNTGQGLHSGLQGTRNRPLPVLPASRLINGQSCALGQCLPRGSLMVNLAHPDPARKEQAYETFVDELSRCDKMGIKLYNFHPGNSRTGTREEGIVMIAQNKLRVPRSSWCHHRRLCPPGT